MNTSAVRKTAVEQFSWPACFNLRGLMAAVRETLVDHRLSSSNTVPIEREGNSGVLVVVNREDPDPVHGLYLRLELWEHDQLGTIRVINPGCEEPRKLEILDLLRGDRREVMDKLWPKGREL